MEYLSYQQWWTWIRCETVDVGIGGACSSIKGTFYTQPWRTGTNAALEASSLPTLTITLYSAAFLFGGTPTAPLLSLVRH